MNTNPEIVRKEILRVLHIAGGMGMSLPTIASYTADVSGTNDPQAARGHLLFLSGHSMVEERSSALSPADKRWFIKEDGSRYVRQEGLA